MGKWIRSVAALVVMGLAGNVATAEFRVTPEVLTRGFVGFGANISPYVYCSPNWPAEVNEGNVGEFEKRVVDLGPQHVRIFIKPEWWDTEEFRYRGQSVERLCRLMDRAGATVNLTLWGGVKDKAEEMGRRTAAAVAHLIRDEKLTCIRYSTLQNEPNGFNMDKDRYVTLYRAFDTELRRLGVRDQVKIIGGDLLSTDQEAWFTRLGKDLSGVLDGYSVHMYSDYWDTGHMYQRVVEIPPIVKSLPAEGQKPLYLMEFGVRGHRETKKEEPGRYTDGRQMYELPLTGNLLAYHVIEALNHGYVATCQWDMADVMYDRSHMHYGVIGEPKDGFPAKPCYHVLRLFTRSAGPGWETVKVTGTEEGKSVAAMRKGGDWAVFAINRGEGPAQVTVAGLPAGTDFHVRLWTGDGEAKEISHAKADGEGKVSVSLPVLGVAALTTK